MCNGQKMWFWCALIVKFFSWASGQVALAIETEAKYQNELLTQLVWENT
jgi:hypothetical protein